LPFFFSLTLPLPRPTLFPYTTLFRSHELTGDSMTWTMGDLVANPPVLARLRQALGEVAGEGGIRAEHFAKLPYLDAVVYEGLRRSEEHTSELQHLVISYAVFCLKKKKKKNKKQQIVKNKKTKISSKTYHI